MRSCSPLRRSRCTGGLTLLELMVTLALVLVMLALVLGCVDAMERSWKSTTTDPFAEAENAFDGMARALAEATLESYQDYADSAGAFRTNATTFVPDHLARRSDLVFVCGPASGSGGLFASTGRIAAGDAVFFTSTQGYAQKTGFNGMEHLLNAGGYWVEFGSETSVPSFVSSGSLRWRWRLKEVRQPTESLQIYALSSTADWMRQLVSGGNTILDLADNVIALVILPEGNANDPGLKLSSDFRYDSRDAGNPSTRHQLPPRLRVTLMAIDETSARILASKQGTQPPSLVPEKLFQQAALLDSDLSELDRTLTAQGIRHHFFDRTITLPAAAWSNAPSQ